MEESQATPALEEALYDDPSQLSQALRQRAGSDRQLHFTTSTESHPSGNSVSAFVLPQQPYRAPLLQLPVARAQIHAPSARRVATAKYVKPALPTHHSAPTSTGIVAELEGAARMHHTFSGMDAPGDTQPDSQMHRQWTSGVFPAVVELPNAKSLFTEHEEEESEDEDDLPTDDVEVVRSSQEHPTTTITSPAVVDVDDQGEETQNMLAPTSPLKFDTPALGGRKRTSSLQALSSAVRTNTTPGTVVSASGFFPTGFANGNFAGGPMMSLTQIWENTQAPTSPAGAVGGANEDIVFQRPSPNFTNMRHSSPGPAYSSPIKAAQPESPRSDPIMRSSSEPRAEYVTMKQSQEQRKYLAGDERIMRAEQDSWEDLSRQVKRRKAKEEFHRQAARSLSHISAPSPVSPQGVRKRTVNAKYRSPTKARAPRGPALEADDDESMDELLQPMPVKTRDAEEFSDEQSQNVSSTARAAAKHNSNHNRVQVPKTSSHPHRTPSGQVSRNSTQQASPSSQLQRECQLQVPASRLRLQSVLQPQSSTESVAIMDSQPDANVDSDRQPPKSLRFPSSSSTNQYSINQTTMATKTGFTSQAISSSMPPMPPESSPEVLDDALAEEMAPRDEERVPSSPPILTHEEITHDEDIEYDEHAYDEYADGEVDQAIFEPQIIDEDDVRDEDDGLPIAKEELIDVQDAEIKEGNVDADDELDLIKPQKVDLETDQQVSKTLQHEDNAPNESQNANSDKRTQIPRLQRQNTVPETDALEETQPSLFLNNDLVDATDKADNLLNHTNSTAPFQTAQEEQHLSPSHRLAPLSSIEDGSDTIQAGDRIRSINDIQNLPESQLSAAEEEIEMPRLSGFDETDADAFVTGFSPVAKRRKVTYTAKRKVIRGPSKQMADSESLSNPNPNPDTPFMQTLQAQETTPPTASAQQREDQGALAAAHAREEAVAPYIALATRKTRGIPRLTKPLNHKKGTLKPISRELLQSLSSPLNSPSRVNASSVSRPQSPITPTKRGVSARDPQPDIDMPDVVDDRDELADPIPQVITSAGVVKNTHQSSEMSAGDVLVPNRVFASWPGSHYYPATCIGRTASRQLRIRFDDGNVTMLDAVHVRALDIRAGDQVKVDEPGMKRHTYVVVGFKDKIEDGYDQDFPTTDQLGFTTIVLEEKQRDSLPTRKGVKSAEQISVPMGNIYLTAGLWSRLRDRPFKFSPPVSPIKAASRIGTPVTEPIATPSFTRRGIAAPSLLKDATARAASVASTARSGNGVFNNMAFVLTSTAADVDKDAIAKVIKTNGGQVLEHGFHELFDCESADVSSSQGRRKSISFVEESVGLALKPAYNDLGFVALISDSHSRSTKYIQALALNVPCLHLRWIQDSLAAARALFFAKYLLPAGVSKFLDPNGAVRSRTMQIYEPSADDISFASTISGRDLLLDGQTVLLITGKSKKEIEKRQPFIFLTHALGSANVGRCADLNTASHMLNDGQWDWVYVDNGERGVADAAVDMLGTEKPAAGIKGKKSKKRKRDDSEDREELVARGIVEGRLVRITCAEFVIQSLILGALIEE